MTAHAANATSTATAGSSASVRKAVVKIVGEEHVSDRQADRMAYSHDLWPKTLIWMREGLYPHQPDLIVWPANEKEVLALLKIADSEGIPIVPYGAGAGVCGGVIPLKGGLSVDVKRMSRVLDVDGDTLTATTEPGIVGEPFERELARRGFTLGHFPSSIYCSSVGGFLASRSAGQLSAKYGKIEDMVLGMDFALPGGRKITVPDPAHSTLGPDLLQVLVGSEGTLGIITKARLKIHPMPEAIRFQGFLFRSLSAGLEAIREILRAGVKPAAVRLYDELDTFLVGAREGEKGHEEEGKEAEARAAGLGKRLAHALKERADGLQAMALRSPALLNRAGGLVGRKCLLILTFEGNQTIAEAEHRVAAEVARKQGGENRGPAPAEKWWRGRYNVSYKLPVIFRSGAFADTIEVAAHWDRVEALYREIRRRISPHAFIMAHFSHAYPEGCSIYFTFATARKTDKESEAAYDRIWEIAMGTTLEVGGTIAHHHGVGMSKARWMEAEHGGGMQLYRAVKQTLDPNGIMNPGKMGL